MQLKADQRFVFQLLTDEPLEDWQEEHFSADIVEVALWIRDICNLSPEPSEGSKIYGFQATQDPDDQPSSSYCLQVGKTSADILVDIDNCI